jgi:hypothetical protein
MPASSGVLSSLAWVHFLQAVTRFSQVLHPPRERGSVIERQLNPVKLPVSVLACVVITKINVLLCNYLHANRDVLKLDQPNHARLIDSRINHALR